MFFDLKKYFVTTKTLDILTNDVTYVNSSQTNVINGVDFGIMINQTSDKNRNLLVNCALENPEIVDMTNPKIIFYFRQYRKYFFYYFSSY